MTPHVVRGILLYHRQRLDLAAEEFRQALAHDADNSTAHAWLAICLVDQHTSQAAMKEAREGVSLGPNLAFTHYALAYVLEQVGELKAARAACQECLRLNPEEASYWARMASVQLGGHNWQEALEAAEAGLRFDAQHEDCLRFRAAALLCLRRREESTATIRSALQQNPESTTSHTINGWALLHSGRTAEALSHFQEALRLNADNWRAQLGMVEALKARGIVYRRLLWAAYWLGTTGPNARGLVFIGLLLIDFALAFLFGGFSGSTPRLLTMLWTPVVLLQLFSHIGEPLFNLTLRFDPLWRRVLSREQVLATNWLVACLAVAAPSFAYYLITSKPPAAVFALVVSTMTVPICSIFKLARRPPRGRIVLYAIGLFVVGMVAVVGAGYWADAPRSYEAFFGVSLSIYGIGWWLFASTARFVYLDQLRRP